MKISIALKKFFVSERFLFAVTLIVLTLTAYLWGRKSVVQIDNPPITIDTSEIDCGCAVEKESETDSSSDAISGGANTKTDSKTDIKTAAFVSSKNGSKYYPLDCKSANRIKEENRVYYTTEAEAEADGKELSSQCQ